MYILIAFHHILIMAFIWNDIKFPATIPDGLITYNIQWIAYVYSSFPTQPQSTSVQ